MTWIADVQGVESGQPREGIEIRYGIVRYLIATGSRDIKIDGNTYKASPAARGAIGVSFVGSGEEIEIKLPVSHEFSQRWIAQLSPPRNVSVIVKQKQMTSGESETVWRGVLSSCRVQGHIATFKGLASSAYAMQRQLSTVTVGRSCPHVLYDANCRVPRTVPFRQVTTVASHDGRTVVVASIGSFADHYAQFGELIHIPSGERMEISEQIGATITLQMPIVELRDGDAVHVYAGCAQDITTCHTKFGNQARFGGSPRAPRENPMIPGKNLGIIVQE